MRNVSLVMLAAALFAGAPACLAAEPTQCKLIRIDEWRLKPHRLTPTLDGTINGKSIEVLLDTGMGLQQGALLERAAARRLGIPLSASLDRTFIGVGGEGSLSTAVVDEFRIGQATRRVWDVLVGGAEHGQQGFFIIGNRFFQKVELELDLAHDAVRLFQAEGCRGVSLAYWAGGEPVNELPVWLNDAGVLTVEVRLNGKGLRAVVDSGAAISVVDTTVAASVGVTSQKEGTTPGGCLFGAGKQALDLWIGQFESFSIGGETIRNPNLHFADMRRDTPTIASAFFRIAKYETPEMLLGADFLRAHRVLISQNARMFFTYSGGPVFPTDHFRTPCPKPAATARD